MTRASYTVAVIHGDGVMAGGQSTGTSVAPARETGAFPGRHAARVESVAPRETVPGPSLPGASAPSVGDEALFRRAEVELSWPLANLGPSLANLLATVAGNPFELRRAWDAAMAGEGLEAAAVRAPELRQAQETFG